MNLKRTIAATAVGLVGLAGGAGIASASSSQKPTPPPVTSQQDPGPQANVQQGDQTTPDAPGSETTKESTVKESTVKESTVNETGTTPGDNPAGHADPAGNVDHQGGANEL